jgi:DNA-binding response OmpR family regulator
MIHRLRRKVADAGAAQLPLLAVHGEGYVFNA